MCPVRVFSLPHHYPQGCPLSLPLVITNSEVIDLISKLTMKLWDIPYPTKQKH